MAGTLYFGRNKICPVNLIGGGVEQQPFPVRSPAVSLKQNGYANCNFFFNRTYKDYTELPFYFDGSGIEAIELAEGTGVFSGKLLYSFQNSSVTYVDFPNLNHLPTKATIPNPLAGPFMGFIYGTENVHIYFRALNTSTVFQQRDFERMCMGATNATIHLQQNMETIISGLSGYPSFTGTNTTLVFDLPIK